MHFIQDDTLLVIGWGTSVKVVSIRNYQNKGANGSYTTQTSSMNKVDIVASFQTSYFISGIAPFGDSLVVLAYIPVEEGEKDFTSSIPSRQVFVLSFNNTDLVALSSNSLTCRLVDVVVLPFGFSEWLELSLFSRQIIHITLSMIAYSMPN